MQFLPVNFQDSFSSSNDLLGRTEESAAGFADMLNEQAASLRTEAEPKGRAARHGADSAREAADTVEGMTKKDLKNMKVSREEFEKVKASLKEHGFSEEDIEELEAKLDSNAGLTWGNLVSAIMHKSKELADGLTQFEISPEQKQELLSLFQKTGFTPQESETLLGRLAGGDAKGVLQQIQQKLSQMAPGETLSIDAREVNALADVLKLSGKEIEGLKRLVAQSENGGFTAEQAKSIVSMLQSADATRTQNGKDTLRDLKDSLADILRGAADRANSAGMRDSEKVMRTGKDKQAAEQFLGREGQDAGRGMHGSQAEHHPGEHGPHGREAKDDKGKGDWDGFWEKIATETTRTAHGSEALFQTASAEAKNAAETLRSGQTFEPPRENISSREVFDQVKSGLLKNLSDGSRQLTLNLTPEDLGALHVTLQVKGNEIKALIRTDNADTSRLVGEQLAQLKQSLEEQGFKVSELDVETGLPQHEQGMNWQNAEQHNQAREREAMARLQTRMRNLRNATTAPAATAPERIMTGLSGMHIIA